VSDLNPPGKRFLRDLEPAGAVPGAESRSTATSLTDRIECESEKNVKE
jgi:hypothetical protein